MAKPQDADRFKQSKCAERIGIRGVFRGLETHLDVALCGEIVNFVRLNLLDDANEVRRIGEVAIMQEKANAGLMRVMIQMIDTIGVDQRRPPLHAMHDIVFGKEKLGEERAVLPGDAGDQGHFF